MNKSFGMALAIFAFILLACNNQSASQSESKPSTSGNKNDTLPAPFATESVKNFCKIIGWGEKMPVAPEGFKVQKFADSLDNPRWIYIADNGDVFVSEANNQIKGVKKLVTKIGGPARPWTWAKVLMILSFCVTIIKMVLRRVAMCFSLV